MPAFWEHLAVQPKSKDRTTPPSLWKGKCFLWNPVVGTNDGCRLTSVACQIIWAGPFLILKPDIRRRWAYWMYQAFFIGCPIYLSVAVSKTKTPDSPSLPNHQIIWSSKGTRFINVIGSLVKKPLQLIYLSLHLLLLIWLLTCGRQGVEWLNDIKPGGRPFLSSPGSGFAQEISKEPSSLSEQPYCSVDHCSNCIFLSEIKMIW